MDGMDFNDSDVVVRRGLSDGRVVTSYQLTGAAEQNPDCGSDSTEVTLSGDSDLDINTMMELKQAAASAKPLMYPRVRSRQHVGKLHYRPCWARILWPCVYMFIVACALGAVGFLCVYVIERYHLLDHIIPVDSHKSTATQKTTPDLSFLRVSEVWTATFPKLLTESSFRLLDINNDGDLDIIMAFATGGDRHVVPSVVCNIYFPGESVCGGGVLALDGATGEQIWRLYSAHELFSLNCGSDLNNDNFPDCIAAGRVGGFLALSGLTGELLWIYNDTSRNSDMNLYTGQFISDLDGDGVSDILNIHGGDPFGEPGSATRLSGKVLLVSGRTGMVIRWSWVPDNKESYDSPVVYTWNDGTDVVLFGTGGETHGGAMWVITLDDLVKGNMQKAFTIFTDAHKGVMTPPVLVDITHDGVVDIIFSAYNASVLAIDGQTFSVIWNQTFGGAETYATPAPGYYNEDDIPDFLVHWQYGPGFPIYYYSQTTVLDGRSGEPLINPYIRDSVGAQASPLTLSVQGHGSKLGHDLFLYWSADCLNHEGEGDAFDFVEGTNVHEKSRSDFCRLRFQTHGYSELLLLGRQIKSPGIPVYNSEDYKSLETSAWVDTEAEANRFLEMNPEHKLQYEKWQNYMHWLETQAKQQTSTQQELKPPTMLDGLQDRQRVSGGARGGNLEGTPRDRPSGPELEYDVPSYEEQPYRQQFSPSDIEAAVAEMMDEMKDQQNWKDDWSNQSPDSEQWSGSRGRRQGQTEVGSSEGGTQGNNVTESGRGRRHVGPHDEGGLQRLISTGTLAPPLLPPSHPDYSRSMDVVFATYWFYPAKTKVLLADDQKCIDEAMRQETQRFNPNNEYYGMDHDAYQHEVYEKCTTVNKSEDEIIYESQSTYNPYNIHMGQMTIYRFRVTFNCDRHNDDTCLEFLPFQKQQWAAYMGTHANSHMYPRK